MSITRHHIEWLSLVPNSGPFLSLPVLAQAFAQGLDAHDADHARRLRMAFVEWDENQLGKRPDPGIHQTWIKLVLAETLGYDELLAEKQEIPQTLRSELAEYGVTLRPDWIVNDPATKKVRLLVQVYPRSQSLTKPVPSSRWHTSPDTRMMQLLHDTGIRLGIVTNGDHWMLVNAPKNETTGYASWYSNLWLEEQVTLRAFRTLLCADRLFSVPENETLEALLDKSADDQQEVTDQLGYQVRKAVEVLIQSLDKADQDHGRKLLADVDERLLYESALTVMMRLVFLFCAEERELLLLGDDLYDKNYAVSTLREQLRVTADQFGEEILGLRYDAWTRLLTSFRAVYAGAKHDRLKLPAYGGSLFNPDRFPFLEGRKLGTSWKDTEATPLPVSNRTVLHLLEALQVLQVRLPGGGAAEARKLSFRALDIEQIGHVYEGLLDHTAKRAKEPVLGLGGTRDKEPEIALAELEKLAAKGEKELLKFLKEETGRSESALKKGLKAELDDQLLSRFRTGCEDSELWKRVKPFAGLVRLDTVSYPVVITTGSVFVTAGTDRRSSGTHYTPKSLTEPIVQYTLEPLVYIGPAEGLPKEQWKLRSAKELLTLKICDMACGSGAFLVQACRYMAARLLEAWDAVQRTHPGTVRITPEGEPSTGQPGEMLIPDDPDERQTFALRIVAQRCLYGVDKNPLAAEMAKLSLWLLTLAKDKPFEFLDHAIRCGDSLVGIHHLDQLRKFNLDGKGEDNSLFLQFLDPKIKEAIALRRQITEMQANTVEDVEAQDRILREANEKIDRLKCAADFLIAAEFTSGSSGDKRGSRDDASIKVAVHFHDSALLLFRREARKALNGQVPFHWPLEFPEVLVDRHGFDAFIGNPPFMGGQKITGYAGTPYRQYLVSHISNRRTGSADLCAYFLLTAVDLLNPKGCGGFITTNTIAQGETRQVCLDALLDNGSTIFRAIQTRQWPGEATLEIAELWLSKSKWSGECSLSDRRVPAISSLLTSSDESVPKAQRLKCNAGISFQGNILLGTGFILSPDEAADVIARNPKNRDVIFPYLNGADLNSNPEQKAARWVIQFDERSLEDSQQFVEPWQIVTDRVKPERMTKDAKKYPRMVHEWWKHWNNRRELREAIAQLPFVLVRARVSDTHAFALVPSSQVFSDQITVIAFDTYAHFAILQSEIHNWWYRPLTSSLRTDVRYSPTDALETFVWPANHKGLAEIGTLYYERRIAHMQSCQEGLTTTYNRFHDETDNTPAIVDLRQQQQIMDRLVADAFGWADLELDHSFYPTRNGPRFTLPEALRQEVFLRLLELNRQAADLNNSGSAAETSSSPRRKGGKKNKTQESGPSLF